jgi:hypothetical protein
LPEIPPAKVRKWRNEEAKRRQWLAQHPEVVAFERKLDELAQRGRAAAEAERQAERQRVIDLGNEEIARAKAQEERIKAVAERIAAQQKNQ